jgi:hypothetical protein
MIDHENSVPVKLHPEDVDALTRGAPAKQSKGNRTTFVTVKLVAGMAQGAQPLLPESDNRIHALVNPHTPGILADAASSCGWISKNKGDVTNQNGHFIKAAGQGPYITYATEALWAASDPLSTTDLWLSVTATYQD